MKVRHATATAFVAAAILVGSAAVANAETYEVRRGDTLSHIAAGHGTSWPKLFELNRGIIANPDLIYPGQVLELGSKAKAKPATKPKPKAEGSASTVRPATGQITSNYGMRTHPITGVYKLHTGTDFAIGDGNAYAAKAGTASVKHPGWAGNLVVIDHGGGTVTTYAHLETVKVSNGEQVSAGQVVGRIGARGMATGPHLHFEVLIDGQYTDPLAWLGR